MKIAIRLDDITPDMDKKSFERFKALLDKYKVKPLIGVVPDNKDPKLSISPKQEDFWQMIVNLQDTGWIVAMHGLHHVYMKSSGGLFPLNHKSEFVGLSFDKQDEMIKEGRAILEEHNIITDFFMAPSHTYDSNTLKALKKNGFFRITDGYANAPYVWRGMTFYPISFKKSVTISSSKKGAVQLVVHTNTLTEKDFSFYEKVFKENEIISYPEFLYYPATKGNEFTHIVEYIKASAKYYAGYAVGIRKI